MHHADSLNALHEAMAAAVYRDLPDVEYEIKRWNKKPNNQFVDKDDFYLEKYKRRPYGSELTVVMFEQLWGSTALGYGGVGGQAMTYAYTVIVALGETNCVYFGHEGRLAYTINLKNLTAEQEVFLETAMADRVMPDVRTALNTLKGAIKGQEDEL